jgi:hypothetical protein
MPLISLAQSAPDAVAQFSIQQVVGSAGDGKLRDKSECAAELRQYLGEIESSKIATYVEQCLSSSFEKSGMVLQDLVNELGRRLDYDVRNGLYQGTVNAIGFDGLWKSAEGHSIIVEVKTTDAYRISLNTIAGYGAKLAQSGQIATTSSVLIVVGREDTGELEAQVRGSRHAWDIRLISAEASVKLVQIKEQTEGAETVQKIRSLLTPMEYTRLDQMIDVMFTTAKDVEQITEPADVEESEGEAASGAGPLAIILPKLEKGTWQFTDSGLLQSKRAEIVAALGKRTGTTFIRKSRAQAWDAEHTKRVVSTISKRYLNNPTVPYWFAYHPQWHRFLLEGEEAHLVLGCMDLSFAFALPVAIMTSILDGLSTTTEKAGEVYWHLKIGELEPGHYSLGLPKRSASLPLDQYRLALG